MNVPIEIHSAVVNDTINHDTIPTLCRWFQGKWTFDTLEISGKFTFTVSITNNGVFVHVYHKAFEKFTSYEQVGRKLTVREYKDAIEYNKAIEANIIEANPIPLDDDGMRWEYRK